MCVALPKFDANLGTDHWFLPRLEEGVGRMSSSLVFFFGGGGGCVFFRDNHVFCKAYNSIYPGLDYFIRAKSGFFRPLPHHHYHKN